MISRCWNPTGSLDARSLWCGCGCVVGVTDRGCGRSPNTNATVRNGVITLTRIPQYTIQHKSILHDPNINLTDFHVFLVIPVPCNLTSGLTRGHHEAHHASFLSQSNCSWRGGNNTGEWQTPPLTHSDPSWASIRLVYLSLSLYISLYIHIYIYGTVPQFVGPDRFERVRTFGPMGPLGPTAGWRRVDRRQINLTPNVKGTNLDPLGPKPLASKRTANKFDLQPTHIYIERERGNIKYAQYNLGSWIHALHNYLQHIPF